MQPTANVAWQQPHSRQRLALARTDRAAAGLSFLLELLYATERVRVDGYIDQHMDDGARRPAACQPWVYGVCGCAVAVA